jgi:hypothetical protein
MHNISHFSRYYKQTFYVGHFLAASVRDLKLVTVLGSNFFAIPYFPPLSTFMFTSVLFGFIREFGILDAFWQSRGGGWRKIVLRGVLRGGGWTDTPGGGWICLSVTEVHLTQGEGGSGGVTKKQWKNMDPDEEKKKSTFLIPQKQCFETDTRESNAGTATVTEDETMIEAGARESNADTAGVTQTEAMVGAGARETNTVTGTVTVNSENTSKGKVTGEKETGKGRKAE